MNARPDTSAEPLWVVPVGIAVVSAFCLWQIYRFNFLSDDAFITFRYARNLADGYGFVFNPGQRVEGSTSTLWTFMLAGMHAVTALDIVATARLFGALFGVAVVIETWRLARVSSPAGHPLVQLLAPAILIGSPSFAAWAAAGLETALFTYLVTALMRATLEGRRWASAVVASLAVLTRPEGLVPAAILVGYWLWEDRGRRVPVTLRQIGLITAVCAGVFIVRFVYFGDWLPNTYYVKAGGGIAAWKRGVVYALDYARDSGGLTVAFGPVLFAPLVGRSSQRLLAVTAAGFWFAAIQVGGDGLPLYRFAIPQLPAIAVLTAFVVGHIHTHVARDHGPATAGLTAAGAAALILVTGVSSPVSSRYSLYLAQRHVELPRWTAVGRWLRSNAHPGESIAAVPIGAVSYFSGLTAVDMLGLTDRHIAHVTMTEMGHGWAGHEKHDGAYVLNLRPTYLLLGNIDVTSQPRDRSARPFIPVRSAAVLARERDILDSPLLESLYEPASALVAPGAFLNYYRLRADRQPR